MGAGRVDQLFLDFQTAVAGRYSIERELGRGGMGVVYLARDVRLDRHVAIKLLPPERALDDAVRERFTREARLAAKLSHPNIIPIFAVDETDGFVFYVMAFVDGETLGDRIRSRGPMSAAETTRVLREVSWALGHAHAHGVVHRDVKPENVLLERGSGRALVTDFGIAAALADDENPAIAGTPEYMSPEQALGGDLDARSDLYAVGATAYFVVSGRPPFGGASPVDVVAHQVATPLKPLAAIGVAVPRRLAHLIEKCLEKDPAHRPATAQVLADQLGDAVEARREVPAMLRAFVKRNGRVIGPGTAIFGFYFGVLLLIGVASEFGALSSGAAFVGVVGGIPFLAMAWEARRLLRGGFAQADVGLAFDHEIEQLREEFLSLGRVERPRLYRAAGRAMLVGLGAFVVGAALPYPILGSGRIGPVITVLGGALAFGGAFVRALLGGRRPHATVEWWRKLWMGRIGRAAFALARRLGGAPVAGVSSTHRATEMALGMAAADLFAALPASTRRALGDVPTIAGALQQDATRLRVALDRLQDALDQAGAPAAGAAYDRMRGLRDDVSRRHKQAVATLETMRLNLLQLHAGAIKVEGCTTHFDQAGEVATEVRRLLEARGELERFLGSPANA